tara:strand:- start:570 stop:791 length:222 start_codon:yes stop_codon:yes gene_type:complete
MNYFIVKCEDLVFSQEVALQLAELLSQGVPVSSNYRSKKWEIASGSNTGASLVPFSAATFAKIHLDLQNEMDR